MGFWQNFYPWIAEIYRLLKDDDYKEALITEKCDLKLENAFLDANFEQVLIGFHNI